MKKSIPVKHAVLLFLALHTAIILMFAYVFKHNEPMNTDPAFIAAAIAVIVAITLYTAYRITESIKEKIERRALRMAQYFEYLQARSKDLDSYAAELKQWASDMSKQQIVLQQRVEMINDYGNRMNELAMRLDVANSHTA